MRSREREREREKEKEKFALFRDFKNDGEAVGPGYFPQLAESVRHIAAAYSAVRAQHAKKIEEEVMGEHGANAIRAGVEKQRQNALDKADIAIAKIEKKKKEKADAAGFSKLKVADLKNLCELMLLPKTGEKADLLARINARTKEKGTNDTEKNTKEKDMWSNMSKEALTQACEAMKLSTNGTEEELIE